MTEKEQLEFNYNMAIGKYNEHPSEKNALHVNKCYSGMLAWDNKTQDMYDLDKKTDC